MKPDLKEIVEERLVVFCVKPSEVNAKKNKTI
jgi:hypothetical protein